MGGSFVFEADHPVDASFRVRGVARFIAISALLVWLALRSQALPIYNGMLRSLPWKAYNRDAEKGIHCNHSLRCAKARL